MLISRTEIRKEFQRNCLVLDFFTTKQMIDSFLLRAFFDIYKNTFFVFDAHLLSKNMLTYLLDRISFMTKNLNTDSNSLIENLVIFVKSESEQLNILKNSSLKQLVVTEEQVTLTNFQSLQEKYENTYQSLIPIDQRYFTSNIGLLGKTTKIQQDAKARGSKVFTLPLIADISPATLHIVLKNLQAEVKAYQSSANNLESGSRPNMTLHIMLDMQSDNKLKTAYLDQLLFKI